MPIIENPHTKQCWGIDASGLDDECWCEFEDFYPHAIRWSSRLWVTYLAKGTKPVDYYIDARPVPFFRIEEPPTPRGKKVTILPGAKGL